MIFNNIITIKTKKLKTYWYYLTLILSQFTDYYILSWQYLSILLQCDGYKKEIFNMGDISSFKKKHGLYISVTASNYQTTSKRISIFQSSFCEDRLFNYIQYNQEWLFFNWLLKITQTRNHVVVTMSTFQLQLESFFLID